MGGRITSVTTVCNACNNSFTGIEGTARDRIATQGALIGALRGDNEPITAIVEFEGSKYRAADGRMDEIAGPPTERGRVWEMPARREDQVKVIVAALRSRGYGPDAILDGRFKLTDVPEQPAIAEAQANPIEHSMIWCDRVSKRVMTKIAVELLAYQDGAAGRRPELDRARRFARYDDGDFYAGVDTETSGARLPLLDAPYVHGIEVWTAGTNLNYRMTLFKELHFVGTLTTAWAGAHVRCCYRFNAQAPSDVLLVTEDGDGATLVNKSDRVRLKERDVALATLEEFNLSTSERRRTRAAPPSFEDLYPDVVAEMKRQRLI
jgi:hypothetical protein